MAVIDKRYAEALLELAIAENACEAYLEEAKVMLGLLNENTELMSLYVNPKITLEEKLSLTESCFGNAFSKDIVGLVSLVVRNGRSAFLTKILEGFITDAKEHLGIAIVKVCTARELTSAQLKALEQKILATTAYKACEISVAVDPSLIGGMTVRMGDRVIDNTIKTKLDEMTRSLRQANLRKDG